MQPLEMRSTIGNYPPPSLYKHTHTLVVKVGFHHPNKRYEFSHVESKTSKDSQWFNMRMPCLYDVGQIPEIILIRGDPDYIGLRLLDSLTKT